MKLRSVLAPDWRETVSTRVRSIKVKTIGIWIPILIVHIASTVYAQEPGPRLWITDDAAIGSDGFTGVVYEVTVDGEPISMFDDVKRAVSGIALDPFDDTLWGASEKTIALPRGSVVNFDKDGNLLSLIPAADFDACMPEGVAVDFYDKSLWVVDDPPAPAPSLSCSTDTHVATVYHISKDGTLIDWFPTSTFDFDATSPQAIAADHFDGTLWLTDNNSDTVYHIERNGELIESFPSPVLSAQNPQGISVDKSNWTLWVTDRNSQTIFNIIATGDDMGKVITSFDSSVYDTGSHDPTGVAFDWRAGRTRLRAVIDDLQMVVDGLEPDVSDDDKKDRDLIVDAIEQIEKSLKLKRWIDPSAPNPKKKEGEKVFNENKKAIECCKGSGGLVNVKTDVSGAIDALLDIHFGLAIAAYDWAIEEAIMACEMDPSSDPCTDANKKIADADKKLVEAQKEEAKGDPERAMSKYKDAWKKAIEAIQKANPGNAKPVANSLTLTTAIGQPIWFQLTGSDPDDDHLWFALDKQPGHGTVMLNNFTGVGYYTPHLGFTGEDKTGFRVIDGIAQSDKRDLKFKVE